MHLIGDLIFVYLQQINNLVKFQFQDPELDKHTVL